MCVQVIMCVFGCLKPRPTDLFVSKGCWKGQSSSPWGAGHTRAPCLSYFLFLSCMALCSCFLLSSFLLVCELSSFIYLSFLFPALPNCLFPFSIRSFRTHARTHTHTHTLSLLSTERMWGISFTSSPSLSIFLPSLRRFQKFSISPHVSYLFLLPSFFSFCLLIRNVRKRWLSASKTSVQQTHRKWILYALFSHVISHLGSASLSHFLLL